MGNYGVKIAKAGYDYDDGDRRLIYNSANPMLKMMATGTGTLTLSGGNGTKTVYTHSLGYKPMFYLWITYIDPDTGSEVAKYTKCSWMYYCGLQTYDYYIADASTTLITLTVSTAATLAIAGGTGTDTLDYFYVVYYDPIS